MLEHYIVPLMLIMARQYNGYLAYVCMTPKMRIRCMHQQVKHVTCMHVLQELEYDCRE